MNATLWLVLVVTGGGLLYAMDYVNVAFLDAVLVRAAAFSFAGAGVIGAAGWLGSVMTTITGWINSAGASVGMALLGTGAIWVLWALLSIAWVMTLLPESWFGADIPDWLSYSGIVLPSLAASIPGPMGHALSTAINTAGHLMVTAATQAVT